MRRFNYTGVADEIPHDATHITVDQSVRVIPAGALAFYGHPNIEEVVCDVNVKGVGRRAFQYCPSLRRVIMPGVVMAEREAFNGCEALTEVEFGKLEIIKSRAFSWCRSLRSINLLSAMIVEKTAFAGTALTEVTFSRKLERIENLAFVSCPSLERITIPLKDGLITHDDTFIGCDNLRHVDLVEGELHETIAALQLEEWRNDMNEEINSINQILPTAPAGTRGSDDGEKARVIRTWIRSVIGKIVHYQAEHRRLLDEEVATTLQHVLPQDIVMNSVLPFVDLPSCTFE